MSSNNHNINNNHTSTCDNPPTLSSLLRQLHETLHAQWLNDFLFTPEPIHIPYVSTPPSSPLLCQIHTSRVAQPFATANTSSFESTPLSTLLNARFLLMPAFTASGVTLGFGVIDGHDIRYNPSTSAQPTFGPQDIAFRKTVRFFKHTTGQKLFVMMLDEPNADALVISACWHDAATASTSLAAKLNRTPFLQAVRENDGVVLLSHLQQHTRSVSQQRLFRACPRCGRRENCMCGTDANGSGDSGGSNEDMEGAAERPKHTFDFAHFERTLASEFGVFEGTGVRIGAMGENANKVMSFGVTSCMQSMRDEDGVRDMSTWAARRSFGVVREEASVDNDERKITGWGDDEESIKYLQMKDAEDMCNGANTRMAQCSPMVVETISRGSNGQADGVDKEDLGMEDFTGDEYLLSESMVQDREDEGKDLGKEAETESSNVPSLQVIKGEEEVLTKETAERRQRMLLRKERNRLAAQRSNLRKKLERDAMKQELSTLHDKEEHLREREATLRKENLLLKELVTERDGQ